MTFFAPKIQFSDMSNKIQAPRGLEGVVVTKSSISKIDGQQGRLLYRGYDAPELVSKLSFEAVTYLLWNGRLPSEQEMDELRKNLVSSMPLDSNIGEFLEKAPHRVNPLVLLRSTTSLIGMLDSDNPEPHLAALTLLAKFPSILASFDRIRRNQKPILPRSDISFAENYLYMLRGNVPSKEHSSALNSYLILLADHGLNASTFSAIVTISTLTDYYSAITSAIGTLKGPLHGGAPSQVWEMFSEIGDPKNARSWLENRIESDERIIGFGHRVYRTEDPRSKLLKSIAKRIATPEIFELAVTVEENARELLRAKHPERTLETNVEFYSAVVLNAIGIPVDMFTATFACSRLVGWSAHIFEQLADNRMFRPESEYVGPEGLSLP